ncbi:DNA-binding protein [Aeromonas bivalvium]|uniref:DNA-binding protein n=1 Tax=Aeromonas bivalvium TaxID=440079 RepID=A0ABW9GLT0_9GAMM
MKKPEQWSRFDAADGLVTEADMVTYLQAALEDGDPALLTAAFDDVERARSQTTHWKNCWPSVIPMPPTVKDHSPYCQYIWRRFKFVRPSRHWKNKN